MYLDTQPENRTSKNSVTFFITATGKYIQYFTDLYEDLVRCLAFFDEIEVILLTDQSFSRQDSLTDKRIRIKKFNVSYGDWVSATLFRYAAIVEYASSITSSKIFWIDADMRIINPQRFSNEIIAVTSITFAKHPGFIFLAKDPKSKKIQTVSLLNIFLPLIFLHRHFSKGTWEENQSSSAYVPPRKRKVYVHGAFFGGPVEDLLKMCETLANCVQTDLDQNYVAIWHDESHLNRFSAHIGRNAKYFSKYFSGADNLTPKPEKSAIWSVNKMT